MFVLHVTHSILVSKKLPRLVVVLINSTNVLVLFLQSNLTLSPNKKAPSGAFFTFREECMQIAMDGNKSVIQGCRYANLVMDHSFISRQLLLRCSISAHQCASINTIFPDKKFYLSNTLKAV